MEGVNVDMEVKNEEKAKWEAAVAHKMGKKQTLTQEGSGALIEREKVHRCHYFYLEYITWSKIFCWLYS